MSIARALAILGAGASGFQSGQEQARQRQRQEEDDAFRREQRERTRTDWQRSDEKYAREKADMEAERSAMAPVPVTEAELPGPVMEGQAPMPTVSKVAGTAYATPQEAQAAAGKMNATGERMRRAAGAVQDPMRAADLEGRANQAETGNLQLQAAREAAASAAFDRELVGSVRNGGWQGLADFLSSSKADGMGGKAKFAVKSEGGKVTLYPVGPDGTALGAGEQFDDNEQGKAKAAFLFKKATPDAQKLEHYRTERNDKAAQEDRRADNERQDHQQASTERYQQGMLDVQRGELGIRANEARLRRAALDAEAKIPPAVKMQYATIDRELSTLNSAITKAQAEGQFDAKSPQAQALMLRQRELTTTAQRILQPYIGDAGGPAAGGDPLGLFGDKPAANDKMAAVKADMAKTGTTGANFDIGGVKGSIGKPAPAAPSEPSTVSRMANAAGSAIQSVLQSARAQGADYQAIDQRVRDAARGGQPLSAEEKAKARQFGIAIPS